MFNALIHSFMRTALKCQRDTSHALMYTIALQRSAARLKAMHSALRPVEASDDLVMRSWVEGCVHVHIAIRRLGEQPKQKGKKAERSVELECELDVRPALRRQ